jgi:hypothetical protein
MPQYVQAYGHTIEFPDGMSQDDITAALKQNALSVPKAPSDSTPAPQKSFSLSDLFPSAGTYTQAAGSFAGSDGLIKSKEDVANLAAGSVRGAGSIGATILYPWDKGQDLYYGDRGPNVTGLITGQQPVSRNEQRRADMDTALTSLVGSDPNSMLYKGAKVGTEIAGTAGAGGALVNGVKAVAPQVITKAPALFEAIRTGGMATGAKPAGFVAKAVDLGTRAVGGGINGAVSAGMVNPSDTGTGAVIGTVIPPAGKLIGAGASTVGNVAGTVGREANAIFRSDAANGAQDLMRALDLTPDQLPAVISQLRGAQTLVDGSTPTLAQALTSPQSAILERVVAAGPGGEKLRLALAAQAEARMNALHGVAPVDPNGFASARTDTGNAIGRFAKAEEGQATSSIRGLYNSVDPLGQVRVQLPIPDLEASLNKFQGPGSFGGNTDAATGLAKAKSLSKTVDAPAVPSIVDQNGNPLIAATAPTQRAATWKELQDLRSSMGEAATKAATAGDKQAAAALTSMRGNVDSAIDRVVNGGGLAGESFPAESAANWLEANASHAAKMDRFHTGPQADIFRTVGGQPAKQGGEISQLFWGNRPGLAEDVQSFRKLIDNNPALLGQFQSMITTEGAAKAAQGGQLGQKFVDWTRNQLPGLREAFKPEQVQTIQNIASDIERATAAAKRGMGPGSNTYQNASTALDAGLIDSPFAKAVAGRIPFIRTVAEPARAAMAESASKAKGVRLAGLLSDANEAATALESQKLGLLGQAAQSITNPLSEGLLGLQGFARPLLYRGAPVALSD